VIRSPYKFERKQEKSTTTLNNLPVSHGIGMSDCLRRSSLPNNSAPPTYKSGFSWPMLGCGYSHDDKQTRTTGATTYSLTQVEDHQGLELIANECTRSLCSASSRFRRKPHKSARGASPLLESATRSNHAASAIEFHLPGWFSALPLTG
jgi:hypothetical protein